MSLRSLGSYRNENLVVGKTRCFLVEWKCLAPWFVPCHGIYQCTTACAFSHRTSNNVLHLDQVTRYTNIELPKTLMHRN